MSSESVLPRQGEPESAGLSENRMKVFEQLLSANTVQAEILEEATRQCSGPNGELAELLVASGAPRHEVLECLSRYYTVPFIEYDEQLLGRPELIQQVNLERCKEALWLPLAADRGTALVIACDPHSPGLREEIERTFKVHSIRFLVALPSDLIRIIENHQDVNPHFPACAGRTQLAKLRTWLADQRTLLAQYRTLLAKGRTGLAFMRTGISFISIGLVLLRIFGVGYLTITEALLMAVGAAMTVDGFLWYVPARREDVGIADYIPTEPTFGTTVLKEDHTEGRPTFSRTEPIEGAQELRARWHRLTPVMKRRFLAIDRTDLAEERTILAHYRTVMARARTGLAFTRTGVAFVGLGIALLREFHAGPWTIFDAALILIGTTIIVEGFHWNISGREAGRASLEAVQKTHTRMSIWEFMFPPHHKEASFDDMPSPLFLRGIQAPGIWGTTGLALERTLIADRRNVKSRLRTIMARSRTGMSFIRTGTSIFSVGMGLMAYFGFQSLPWTIFNCTLMIIGLGGIADGLYWHIPAEKIKRQFPYCFNDMEIVFPDYGKPSTLWKKVVFSHEDL